MPRVALPYIALQLQQVAGKTLRLHGSKWPERHCVAMAASGRKEIGATANEQAAFEIAV